ncbi:MAG TPA: MFS transporter [Desulfomonilia bacterium]|jgi:DHA1 family multidrug resistance protein-like MFS transporter
MQSSAFVILFIASMATSLGISIILPILPVYAKDMGARGFMIGLVFSSFAVTKTIVSPFFGRWADRKGKKPFIVWGLLLFTLVALAFAWAQNVYDLIAIRCFMGISNAMVVPIIGACIGGMARQDNEAHYMSLFALSALMGMAMGPLLGGIVSDRFGINMAFYVMATATAVAFATTLFGLQRNEDLSKKNNILSRNPLKELLAIPRIRGLMVFRFIDVLSVGGMLIFLPLLVKQQHISTSRIGILVSILICYAGIMQLPFGRLCDRMGKHVTFIIFGGAIAALALACLPLARGFWGFLTVGLISASGGAIAGPAANALIVRSSRKIGLGFAVSSFDSVQAAAFIAGPLISGLIMDAFGLNTVFFLTAVIYLLGLGTFFYYSKK